MVRVVLVLSVVVLLAGCGGHTPDEGAWQADVETDLGHPVQDWDGFRELWGGICGKDESAFGMTMAVFLDGGSTTSELRRDIRHACPDRLEDLEATLAVLGAR